MFHDLPKSSGLSLFPFFLPSHPRVRGETLKTYDVRSVRWWACVRVLAARAKDPSFFFSPQIILASNFGNCATNGDIWSRGRTGGHGPDWPRAHASLPNEICKMISHPGPDCTAASIVKLQCTCKSSCERRQQFQLPFLSQKTVLVYYCSIGEWVHRMQYDCRCCMYQRVDF